MCVLVLIKYQGGHTSFFYVPVRSENPQTIIYRIADETTASNNYTIYTRTRGIENQTVYYFFSRIVNN